MTRQFDDLMCARSHPKGLCESWSQDLANRQWANVHVRLQTAIDALSVNDCGQVDRELAEKVSASLNAQLRALLRIYKPTISVDEAYNNAS